MTEAEWLACGKLHDMLDYLTAGVGERKFRLTECAFHRRLWPLLADDRSRRAVEVLEQYADGLATRAELRAAQADAEAAFTEALDAHFPDRRCGRQFWGGPVSAAQHAASSSFDLPELMGPKPDRSPRTPHLGNLTWLSYAAFPMDGADDDYSPVDAEQAAQARLLHEMFGNPFRPASFAPACRSAQVRTLAHVAYEERELPSGHLDNTHLAVLSDALEEAGCADADILSHLRSPGPHVRGCWALDLVLGTE